MFQNILKVSGKYVGKILKRHEVIFFNVTACLFIFCNLIFNELEVKFCV